MSFDIEVECNDYKMTTESFFGQIKAVKKEVNEFIKLAH